VAGQRLLDLGIEPRDLLQEGGPVVRQRVLDLVGHRELRVAQHPGLPQLRDTRPQRGLVARQVARGDEHVAGRHQLGDGPLGIQQALALDFGGVGGEHRREVGVPERAGDLGGTDVARGQPLEGQRQRALQQRTAARLLVAPAHRVPVLGDVGQMREVAERPDHRHGLVDGEALQQPAQRRAGGLVVLEPTGHRELAHPLDQVVGVAPLLFADHLAEDPAEQADVADREVAVVGSGGLSRCRGQGRLHGGGLAFARGEWHGTGGHGWDAARRVDAPVRKQGAHHDRGAARDDAPGRGAALRGAPRTIRGRTGDRGGGAALDAGVPRCQLPGQRGTP